MGLGYRYGATEDEVAVERYRYLLGNAPSEQLEQMHAEAFVRLTRAQRGQVLADLADEVPAGERSDDPRALAGLATRAELRRPGTLERVLGAGNPGYAALGGLLAGVAVAVVGTVLVDGLDAEFGDIGLLDPGHDGSPSGSEGFRDFAC